MLSEVEAYHELCAYTLTHGDPAFIHQHVVDAFMAQHADERTKPIGLTFAWSVSTCMWKAVHGQQVQLIHMKLGRRKQSWPRFPLPDDRGAMTALDVMAFPAGPERDKAIDAWCVSLWDVFRSSRGTIVELLVRNGIALARNGSRSVQRRIRKTM